MRILVVGGSGLIGAHAAAHLSALGHDVAVSSKRGGRRPPALGGLQWLQLDYIDSDVDPAILSGFDALVFCAGQDPRHASGRSDDRFWSEVNSIAVPRFFELAKRAGVRRAINVSSFYPAVAPRLIDSNAYVRSRNAADLGVSALASRDFAPINLQAPFVVGAVPGLERQSPFAVYMQYARNELHALEIFTPLGGTNFISAASVAGAVAGALSRGVGGSSYLIGDENLSFRQFFKAFFASVGREAPPAKNAEHPLMPDSVLLFGRGGELYYDPDPGVVKMLGYRTHAAYGELCRLASALR